VAVREVFLGVTGEDGGVEDRVSLLLRGKRAMAIWLEERASAEKRAVERNP
jgi:hypothetical protein